MIPYPASAGKPEIGRQKTCTPPAAPRVVGSCPGCHARHLLWEELWQNHDPDALNGRLSQCRIFSITSLSQVGERTVRVGEPTDPSPPGCCMCRISKAGPVF